MNMGFTERWSLHICLCFSALKFLSLDIDKYSEDMGLSSRIGFRYALIFLKLFFYYFLLSVFLHFTYFTVSYLLPCWTFFTLSLNGWLDTNFSNGKCSSKRDLFWECILLWTSQFLAFIHLRSTGGGTARGQCLCPSVGISVFTIDVLTCHALLGHLLMLFCASPL